MTKQNEIKLKEQLSESLSKSGFTGIPFDVVSFTELDVVDRTREHIEKANELFFQFLLLADNIMFDRSGTMTDQFKNMEQLSDEFLSRFENLASDANDLSKGSHVTAGDTFKASNGTVSIYKHDDKLWWSGVPTNKFIDDDNPPDIFSDKSHRRFVEGIEKGVFQYPDLYLWHIPKSIGKSTWVAYDERGFLISGGIVYPEYEGLVKELLVNSDEIIGMSHGIKLDTIKRHPKLKHVIDEYNSFEFSFLPQKNAANKLTSFTLGDF